jgi:hypothetical protein
VKNWGFRTRLRVPDAQRPLSAVARSKGIFFLLAPIFQKKFAHKHSQTRPPLALWAPSCPLSPPIPTPEQRTPPSCQRAVPSPPPSPDPPNSRDRDQTVRARARSPEPVPARQRCPWGSYDRICSLEIDPGSSSQTTCFQWWCRLW